MGEFKGTKGKWHTQLSHKEDHKRISIKTDDILCVGLNDSDGDFISVAICGNSKHEVVQANALLISKAPEMLEMLKELREIFDKYSVSPESQFFNYKKPLEKLITEATELN